MNNEFIETMISHFSQLWGGTMMIKGNTPKEMEVLKDLIMKS